MSISLSFIVEIVLSILLAATLVYCALLERKLSALRKSQDGLKDLLSDLNGAIISAGTSIRMLKNAASGAGEALDEKVAAARAAIDELSLLTASGERIAARIEKGSEGISAAPAGPAAAPVGSAAAPRPEQARPRIVRPDISDVLGGVR